MKKKKIIVILSIIFIILASCLFTYLNGKYINPTDFKVTYLDIEDELIPDSFKEKNIIFISDLEYGSFFDEQRLNKFIDQINKLHADIVIFGGDLFDKQFVPMSEDVQLLTEKLKSIKADMGKFAILGDFDQMTGERASLVNKILYDSDFEMLDGNAITLHYGTNEFINLVGINFTSNVPDLNSSFNNIQPESYTITVVHGARMINYLPVNISDLTLSGHSHHVQVNLPFIVDYESYPMTGNYSHGKFNTSKTMLYVTNGIGTTKNDLRIFSDPEIVYIIFK